MFTFFSNTKKRGLEKEPENQTSDVWVKRIKTETYPWDYVQFAIQLMTPLQVLPVQNLIISYLKPHEIQWTVLRSLEKTVNFAQISESIFVMGAMYHLYSLDSDDLESPPKCIFGSIDEKIVPICKGGFTQSTTRILFPKFIGKHQHYLYIASDSMIYQLNEQDGQVKMLAGIDICEEPEHPRHAIEGLTRMNFECILSALLSICGNYIYVLDQGYEVDGKYDLFFKLDTRTGKPIPNKKWSCKRDDQKYKELCYVSCVIWDRREPKQTEYLYFMFKNGFLRRYHVDNPEDMQTHYSERSNLEDQKSRTEEPLILEGQPLSSEDNENFTMHCISGTGILILHSPLLNQLIAVHPETRECQTLYQYDSQSKYIYDFIIDERKQCLYVVNTSHCTLERMTLCPLLFPPPF